MFKHLTLASLMAVIGLLLASAMAPAHGHDHEKADKKDKSDLPTIVEIAAADERFTTLVAAVKKAGLVETLSAEGPFTVFAPTDDAFAKLPEGTVEGLTKEQLTAILTYHVVSGKVVAKEAVKLDGKSVATVNGAEIAISVEDGSVMINDATVIVADVMASNGVIHAIDTVIMPPAE